MFAMGYSFRICGFAVCGMLSLALTACTAGGAFDTLQEHVTSADAADAQESSSTDDPQQDESKAEQPSDAEKITDLERTIESQEKRVQELDAELASPDSEYSKAEQEFRELDGELETAREQLDQFKQQGKTREASLLERSISAAETQWKLAKDRFELAIEERKTLRQEITTLKLKIQKDRDELDELTGSTKPEPVTADATEERTETEADSTTADASAASEPSNQADEEGVPDEELMQAQAEAKEKEKEAQEATEEAQEIGARITNLQKLIAQQQKVLGLGRKKADLALATRQALEEQLAKKLAEGASSEELQELRQGIADANNRYARAHQEVTDSSDRLNDARSELSGLQQEQINALHAAKDSRLQADAAKEVVEELRNPFAPRNVLKWLIEHGPKVVMYLIAMIVMVQSAKVFSHRIVQLMAGGAGRGTTVERENRAKTLVGVFQNAASVTIIIGGTLIILDEMGAKVGVLLGGVAVAGLAVAFGAQNLIKDYFYGFVMLLENQYMLNDIVKIGDLTGQVERITLRMTVLRDANGVVHFIPNGQINCVSNETHGWSRAVFEIGIGYNENIDRCVIVLTELAAELRRDPVFAPMIIEDATIPAVDALGDSAVVLKFFVKTRPHQQGAVRRELLRRIKNRFDELNIEMPFPQRTVHHRYEAGSGIEPVPQMRKSA